ncbi:hypothetical protein OH77DRAFT_1426382 [Trametes cingulata]|nr:hypothetical protein OH77DRAFT_1426382 [Trametes cingulata]
MAENNAAVPARVSSTQWATNWSLHSMQAQVSLHRPQIAPGIWGPSTIHHPPSTIHHLRFAGCKANRGRTCPTGPEPPQVPLPSGSRVPSMRAPSHTHATERTSSRGLRSR